MLLVLKTDLLKTMQYCEIKGGRETTQNIVRWFSQVMGLWMIFISFIAVSCIFDDGDIELL